MTVREGVEAKLAEYSPQIKQAVADALLKTGQSIENYGPEKLFAEVHGMLPLAVRMIVRKKKFVEFCVANQAKFVPLSEA